MTTGFHATDRTVLRVSGPDARPFLQGLVTNDVRRLDESPVYAALLSPQGKYLFDFFLVPASAAARSALTSTSTSAPAGTRKKSNRYLPCGESSAA